NPARNGRVFDGLHCRSISINWDDRTGQWKQSPVRNHPMKTLPLLLCLLCSSPQDGHPPGKGQKPAVLLDGLGSNHHPVSTKHPEAQKYFDQGLRLIYAFNHDEAHRAFKRAADLDPKLAMAHWGMALAVGPNYNLDAEVEQLKAAYASIQKALA